MQALDLWLGQMNDFLYDCAVSAPVEQADRIREACALFDQPHPPAAGFVALPVEHQLIDDLLCAGGFESAVLALVAPETGYMLSRGGNGLCIASVATADGSGEVTVEGTTMALALLGALVSAILAGRDDSCRPGEASVAGASARLN